MAETQITGADIEALAAKLDSISDQFTPAERAALYAVFHLAGSAITEAISPDDVEGFALNAYRNAAFSFSLAENQGILIGLNQGLSAGTGGGMHGGLGIFKAQFQQKG